MNQIVYIPSNRIVQKRIHPSGYCMCVVSDGKITKKYFCYRFIYECCYGIINNGYEIDHIDKNKTNNNIANLRYLTIQENRRCRDHTNRKIFGRIAHQKKRFIKSINIDTNEVNCFKQISMWKIFWN